MARRQDSGSNSSHENQRPNANTEDRIPEFSEDTRGRSDDDDEFDEADAETEMEDDEEEDEGSI